MRRVMRNIAVACGLALFAVRGECATVDIGGIPEGSTLMAGDYGLDAVEQRLRAMPLQPIEGLWYYNEERTTLLIERTDAEASDLKLTYRIVYVESDD